MKIKDALLDLSDHMNHNLQRIVAPDVRFATVIWRHGDKQPLFSTSSEDDIRIAQNMLRRSADMIDEAEIFAEFKGQQVGHA